MHEKPNITPIKLLPPKVRRVCDIAAADFGVTIQAILSGTKVGETSKARRQTIQTLKRQGYSTPQMRVVSRVNDIEIHNLKHLVEVIRDTKQEFLKIEFAGRGTETIVLPRKAAIDATESILSDNGVRSQASADLLAVWNSPPKA